jgi:hypothetical protein
MQSNDIATRQQIEEVVIKGPKDVKDFISTVKEMFQKIRYQCIIDMESSNAQVVLNSIYSKNFNHLAELCCSEHRRFVCKITGSSCDTSFLTQYENDINDAVNQLELLRKMLVSAKQEKNTDVKRMKALLKELKYSVLPPEEFDEFGGGFVEVSSPENHTTTVKLREIIKGRRENYHSTNCQILIQIERIVSSLKKRLGLFANATESVVGEIMAHADKCRAYIQKCRKYALIEYAATVWWQENEFTCITNRAEDEMDEGNYIARMFEYDFHLIGTQQFNPSIAVSSLDEHFNDDDDDDVLTMKERLQFIVSRTTTIEYQNGQIHTTNDEIARYDITKEFENCILTQEAIEGFEWAEQEMWYQSQQGDGGDDEVAQV